MTVVEEPPANQFVSIEETLLRLEGMGASEGARETCSAESNAAGEAILKLVQPPASDQGATAEVAPVTDS